MNLKKSPYIYIADPLLLLEKEKEGIGKASLENDSKCPGLEGRINDFKSIREVENN